MAVTVVANVGGSMGPDMAALGPCLPIVVLLGMLLMVTICCYHLSGAAVVVRADVLCCQSYEEHMSS